MESGCESRKKRSSAMRLAAWLPRRIPRRACFEYAESLADRQPIPAGVARRVTSDAHAVAESKAMRASLEFLQDVPVLDPSPDLTQRILREARQVRTVRPGLASYRRHAAAAARTLAYAGGLAIAVLVAFSAALGDPSNVRLEAVSAVPAATPAPVDSMVLEQPIRMSQDSLEAAAEEVRALSRAVLSSDFEPASLKERQYVRTVTALDGDIASALEALRRNPGCERASNIVQANVERQAQLLRDLYLERTS